jgi:hypothetical protein
LALHITASGAATVSSSGPRGLLIQVNAALTGTITVVDVNGTVAVITNPAVGNTFYYYSLAGTTTVNPSTTCDISVSILNIRA